MKRVRNNSHYTFNSFSILGIRIDAVSKKQFLKSIQLAIDSNKTHYIATPYSEFFLKVKNDSYFEKVLDDSLINIPDGIFPIWATYFLSLNTSSLLPIRIFQTIVQYIYSGALIILNQKAITSYIPERISGSIVTYDIMELASKNNYKVAILGGFDFGSGNTGIIAAEKLRKKYPKLQIVEVYPGKRKEQYGKPVVKILKKSKADILLCCYGPVKQEKWLAENLEETGIKVGIGLGGTIDYISGVKKLPPRIFRKLGLEWLVRPFYADSVSIKAIVKRMKRGWFPAMIKSSIYLFLEKIRGQKLIVNERELFNLVENE